MLVLILLLPLVAQSGTLHAQSTAAPLVFTGLSWEGAEAGSYQYPVPENGTVPRNLGRLIVRFDGQPVLRKAMVTDSQGNLAPISVYPYHPSSWYATVLAPTGPLKPNETYTITIPGGANGERDPKGRTLPQDVKVSFRTDAKPFTQSVQVIVHPAHNFAPDLRSFRFYADKGTLQMNLESLRMGGVVYARLLQADTGAVIAEPVFAGDPQVDWLKTSQTATLPAAGYYDLLMDVKKRSTAQDLEFQVTLTAPELVVAEKNYVPAIRLNMRDYALQPDSFLPPVERYDSEYRVHSVSYYFDGRLYRELANESDAARSLPNEAVSTRGLSDGIHTFAMMAKGAFSENVGGDEKLIQIDRLDNFRDVPHGAWMHPAVELMSDLHIVSGDGNGAFAPDRAVTREEFAKMIATTLSLHASSGFANPFVDVPGGSWSSGSILALAESGLIAGDIRNGKRYFRPGDTITRAEAASIIGRHLGVTAETAGTYRPPFSDYDAVPDWAKPHVAVLQYYSWISGSNGNFHPASTLTRAEAAQILVKYLGV
jgi:hypothetical protein